MQLHGFTSFQRKFKVRLFFFMFLNHFWTVRSFKLQCYLYTLPENVLTDAMDISDKHIQEEAVAKIMTTKEEGVHLIHFFMEPAAQRHWTNLYTVLSRVELDARKSSEDYS